MALLEFTERGFYCAQADVFIDPWKPVDRALITHGHADHSRYGHQHYLCSERAAPAIRYRLGDINLNTLPYGETRDINGVKVSFHPAGHIIGSAQIRLEYKGEVWVAAGDYKLEDDGLSTAFEPVKCHTFITESTFGLPVYQWTSQALIAAEINEWWRHNQADGKVSLISGYSLGKAQRILHLLDPDIGRIYTHGAVEQINGVLRQQGIPLPDTIRVLPDMTKKDFEGAMVVAPPSALGTSWMRRMGPAVLGAASGWMALRGTRRRRAVDRGFVLSDHADWVELHQAIEATEAETIYVTHGYTAIFTRWLRSQGYDAHEVPAEYGEELAESSEAGTTE